MKGGGEVIHNINLQIPIGGNISSNKETAYAGDRIILTATPDVDSTFLSWSILNLTTQELTPYIENPLTYTMPDSDIEVGVDFDGGIELPPEIEPPHSGV